MRLEKKLALWEDNKLITAAQKNKIMDFEKAHKNPILFNALLLLGVFLMALGVISIVAANWDGIPNPAKLVVDFAILLSVVYGTFVAWSKQKNIWFECGLLALFMLVGASIGLVGQIYQLNGSFASAGLFWAFMTLPLIIITKRKVLPLFWLPLLFISIFSIESVVEFMIKILDWWFAHWKDNPDIYLLTILAICGFVAGFFAMADTLTKKQYTVFSVAKMYAYIAMYATVIEFMFVATTFSRFNFFNVYLIITAFLLIMAFVGERLGRRRLVNLNISLLYIDFMCIYFNLFGSLVQNGLGMIVTGAVLIGGLYITRNVIRKLKTLK